MDVTSKTEGAAFADSTGVPLLVKYDARLRENVAKGIVEEVNISVQVGAQGACSQGTAGSHSSRACTTDAASCTHVDLQNSRSSHVCVPAHMVYQERLQHQPGQPACASIDQGVW